MEKPRECKICGCAEIGMRIVEFKDRTQHVEAYCKACHKYLGYLPKEYNKNIQKDIELCLREKKNSSVTPRQSTMKEQISILESIGR